MSRKKNEVRKGGRNPWEKRAGRAESRSISRGKVLKAFEAARGALTMRELAHALHAKGKDDQHSLRRCVNELLESGELTQRGKTLKLQKGGRGGSAKSEIGKVSAHPDGFGFVMVEGREKDLFLPHEEMQGVMHGDTVEVVPVMRRGRESSKLVRIVEEAPSSISGQFVIRGGVGFVEPRSKRMAQAILIAEKDAKGAHDGDWVRAEIKRGTSPLRGHIEEVLGDLHTPERLIDLIVAEQGLAEDFPAAVHQEADALPEYVTEADKKGRMDLTHLPFVTIDGEDARDFDDAVCVLPRGDGFEAWVAIADVTHYVKPGSALDTEALERSNSFYFPDRVIPMLPEKLSNGLCSLNPDVARLAMAARMRYDASGKRRSIRLYNAVIHSRARLTYTQVAAWLEENDEKAVADGSIRNMLRDTERLFTLLERQRERRGALDLDLPETRAQLADGKVTGLAVSERNVAHRLIEEMMLAANTAVAEFFEEKKSPLLYRIHPVPDNKDIESVNEFLAPFGFNIRQHVSRGAKPGDVQRVLEQAEGKPFSHVLHRLILRSMQQAKYTPANEGHFGLAYRSYCHFTSPIRRYADVTVHRRLKALLVGDNPDKTQPSAKLAEIGTQTSTQERKQQRAEWDTQAMLAALYHSKDVGSHCEAIIAGLTKRRVFFELQPTLAEGALSVDELSGEYWLDDANHRLVARRGGHAFHLGERVDVVINSTDPVRGQISVSLAPEESEKS